MVNTTASKVIAALLTLILIATVIGAFVSAANSLSPLPPPAPMPVTVWNCDPDNVGKCKQTTSIGATGYVTEAECLAHCNGRTGYNCEVGTDGWPTGKCIPSTTSFKFSSLDECQKSCSSPDTVYTVQCVDPLGCIPTDGEYSGPSWQLRRADLSPCTSVCKNRYKCQPDKTCSAAVKTADATTYPIADACDSVKNCGLAPTVTYKWQGTTCVPVALSSAADSSLPRASDGAPLTTSDCDSYTYTSFDACMQASCSVCTSQQFPYYCQSARQCALSQSACCGATTCGRCQGCKDGVCQDNCSGQQSGCRQCKSICDKDGKNCKDTCVCNSLPPVQQQCDGLCLCQVVDKTGKASEKFCDQIAQDDVVQTCRVQHLNPQVICGTPDKKVWCLTVDDSLTAYIPGSCKCYDLDAGPPPCPAEYPQCSQIQCM